MCTVLLSGGDRGPPVPAGLGLPHITTICREVCDSTDWQGLLTFVLTRKGYSMLETTGNGSVWLCFRKIVRMLLTLFSYSSHVGAFRTGPRWIRCQAPAVFSHVRFLPIRNTMADQKNKREIGSQRSFQERLMMVAPLDASDGPSIHT